MTGAARLTPDAPTATTYLGHSLTGILGLPRVKGLPDRQVVRVARAAAMQAVWDGATAAVVAIDTDLRLRPVDGGRVNVAFAIEGEPAESQELPVGRFGSWVVDMGPDVEIIDVRLIVPAPTPLVVYGRGHDDEYQCWIEDGRGAAQLLLQPIVLSYFTNRSAEGSRLRDALNVIRSADGAIVAAGACFQVLDDEVKNPTTAGEPVGWWWVADVGPPFAPKARGLLPPVGGLPRQTQIRTAVTAGVSREAYFRTRPGYPGSRDRQISYDDEILPSLGRIVTKKAAKAHKARQGEVLGSGTLTVDEHKALGAGQLVTMNNILWGRVGWRHEEEWDEQDPMPEKDPRLSRQTLRMRYRGGS